jgi:CheY-like chemotaxis protein
VKKSKILVVDDNIKILYSFKTFLEKEGYITISADQGSAVLDLISTEKPSLIFLDISLPDMNGIDILRQIKEKIPSLPVIIVTGLNSEDNRNQARSLGASEFLEKPVSLTRIREILGKLVQDDKDN